MKSASIRILKPLLETTQHQVLSSGEDESVAFLTANCFQSNEKIVFLASTMVPARKDDYLRQGSFHLQVSPMYVNRVINIAEYQQNTVILVHSHPFEAGIPHYSPTDDHGEALTSETISKCLESNPPVGSLVFGQVNVSSRAWLGLSKKSIQSSIGILGPDSYNLKPTGRNFLHSKDRSTVERQIKALGDSVQSVLESLEVGIVGVGGTGSAVAEQLTRMGIRHFTLVDHDIFESSNLSRLYGSRHKDVLKPRAKVDIVKSHLEEINPEVEIQALTKSVMTKTILQDLASCDVIFSCLDRHAPRAVLNELSYQCYVPVIDVGVGLQREKDRVLSGSARATIIGPGFPCLMCQDIIRPEVITAEHLSPKEYEARRVEGYVINIDQDAPSIIHFTNLASSLAIMQFTKLLTNSTEKMNSTVLFDFRTMEVIRLNPLTREECVCQKRLGQGFKLPFSVAD